MSGAVAAESAVPARSSFAAPWSACMRRRALGAVRRHPRRRQRWPAHACPNPRRGRRLPGREVRDAQRGAVADARGGSRTGCHVRGRARIVASLDPSPPRSEALPPPVGLAWAGKTARFHVWRRRQTPLSRPARDSAAPENRERMAGDFPLTAPRGVRRAAHGRCRHADEIEFAKLRNGRRGGECQRIFLLRVRGPRRASAHGAAGLSAGQLHPQRSS